MQIQKTVFEYLHPVTKEWRKKMINGFFEKEELEKQYFDEIKNNRGNGVFLPAELSRTFARREEEERRTNRPSKTADKAAGYCLIFSCV